MTFKWFVLQAYSGFEKQVKSLLDQRIADSDLRDRFGDVLMPCEDVVEIRHGKKRQTTRKLFPGYILVNMDMTDETWHLVNSVPKVKGFIGGNHDKPTPLPDAEVRLILQRIEAGAKKPKPKVLFEAGEMVRVTDGPFNDFNAVVEEVSYEKNKLLVSVQIFGRSTPVELGFGQVEKV